MLDCIHSLRAIGSLLPPLLHRSIGSLCMHLQLLTTCSVDTSLLKVVQCSSRPTQVHQSIQHCNIKTMKHDGSGMVGCNVNGAIMGTPRSEKRLEEGERFMCDVQSTRQPNCSNPDLQVAGHCISQWWCSGYTCIGNCAVLNTDRA